MPPQKRERPALAGTGALDKPNNSAAANTRKRTGSQAARLISDPRFRRRVQHLVERLGSRVTGELLAQLAAAHDCRPQIERFIDAAIENEAAIREFGFDRWPELPLRAVPR